MRDTERKSSTLARKQRSRRARQRIVLERGRAQPAPVVGIAAPIYFAGDAITIGAALCTHLRERRARA
ncbi:TPA: hypothetical protein ACK3Q6_004009 [Burkholderia cepacia]|uniref:hypothetical protein n=1 Tax=Burkholderia cepacia TaxID=292 RepID=UPI001CF2027A|nr:hypothetical protein [Burkholderia cepacia]MCA8361878.1 hypothetical protein [Burkholderia cepacia]HDR9758691.1 hypothetical protein [Burkholderia cepacia ATCC 25416]HDV6371798.1 hypothetical protein [Burkholderia cepacia]